MKVTSAILYDRLRMESPDGGLYVWVDPDENANIDIECLLKDAPFKAVNSTEFHATVLYHRGTLPNTSVMPHDRVCHARIVEIENWEAHDGESIIVALLDSPALQAVHAELLGQNLTHSFPEYRPHITLGKHVEVKAAVRLWLSRVNSHLADSPMAIGFDPAFKAVSIQS